MFGNSLGLWHNFERLLGSFFYSAGAGSGGFFSALYPSYISNNAMNTSKKQIIDKIQLVGTNNNAGIVVVTPIAENVVPGAVKTSG